MKSETINFKKGIIEILDDAVEYAMTIPSFNYLSKVEEVYQAVVEKINAMTEDNVAEFLEGIQNGEADPVGIAIYMYDKEYQSQLLFEIGKRGLLNKN